MYKLRYISAVWAKNPKKFVGQKESKQKTREIK